MASGAGARRLPQVMHDAHSKTPRPASPASRALSLIALPVEDPAVRAVPLGVALVAVCSLEAHPGVGLGPGAEFAVHVCMDVDPVNLVLPIMRETLRGTHHPPLNSHTA